MSYRIIADSCCDKTACMADWDNITFVPLTLEIGDYTIMDDENFNQEDYIKRTLEYNGVAKTACPSPEAWANAIDCEEENIFIITITDKLSGTYNSALQGVALYNDEHPNNNKSIHVFNSLATSGIESLTAEKIKSLADSGESFESIVETVEDFILNRCSLYFCLESLDVLKKNGRLFALAATILKKLRLKLIFERTKEGNISLAGQDLVMNRSLIKMAGIIAQKVSGIDLSDKRLIISHVCCREKAEFLKEKIKANVKFGDIEIVKCSGLNSTYASNGGIIVSYTS
ncbi:MAG: DegV family EDD domain-containing protein [Ruminococcaceae bacterium]|nr:DegV family EDD domain-containing protein [Oscillospiraceae bacterium]